MRQQHPGTKRLRQRTRVPGGASLPESLSGACVHSGTVCGKCRAASLSHDKACDRAASCLSIGVLPPALCAAQVAHRGPSSGCTAHALHRACPRVQATQRARKQLRVICCSHRRPLVPLHCWVDPAAKSDYTATPNAPERASIQYPATCPMCACQPCCGIPSWTTQRPGAAVLLAAAAALMLQSLFSGSLIRGASAQVLLPGERVLVNSTWQSGGADGWTLRVDGCNSPPRSRRAHAPRRACSGRRP